MPQYDAFVSYSRHDAPVVEPVVQLLRFGGRNVFWDRDIEPGTRWSEKIEDAIGNAGTLAVLWCCRAARSPHVKAEIELARNAEKGFLPVLLCSYPVREPLNEYQWIDFRDRNHQCEEHDQEPPHGDGLLFAALVAEEMGGARWGEGEAADPWISKAIVRARSASLRTAMTAFTGSLLAALAVIRPFPSTLSPANALAVNATTAVAGLLLFGYSVFQSRRMRIRLDPRSMALALTIESLIRRSERGESGRARAYA
jgi:hypothetical protein